MIIAEGAASETFVDDDSRGVFHNAPEFYAAHRGYAPQRPARYCAPRLEDGFALEILREKLAGRAARLQPDGTTPAAQIRGNIDVANRNRIAGWVHDVRAPERRVGIVVLCRGVVLARACADLYRRDLERAGIGDGCHAFEVSLNASLASDRRYEIEVRCADDWRSLSRSPKVIEAEGEGVARGGETAIVALGALRGNLEHASPIRIKGWAQDTSQPTQPVALTLSVNDEIVCRFLANRFRADLKKAGIGQGRHSFDLATPNRLSREKVQVIRVQREADGQDVPGSPVILAAAGSYDRRLEETFADILDRTADPRDEDKALALLMRHAEKVLARRAKRTSRRDEREALRLFRRRWGTREDEASTGFRDEASRALVIDEHAPIGHRDAGSAAILSHVRALKGLGYDVTFAACKTMDPNADLDRMAEVEGISTCSKPYYSCVEDVLSRQSGGFDIVYLHRISVAERYLQLARAYMPKARLIYSVADLHHLRLARQAKVEKRPELLAYARAMERRELFIASQADLVVTHSAAEAEILKRVIPHKVKLVPFAAGEREAVPSFEERQGIAFLGSFGHAPNPDAVYWLMREILPRVWTRAPELTCKIAGSGWQADHLGRLDPRIEVLGPVADLDELFAQVRLTVAPLRFGAGVKGKVLESFAAGLPCVMSEVAAEGMPLVAPLTELVGRDAADLAARILRFHDDAQANLECGSRARALVAEHFTGSRVTSNLRAALAVPADAPANRLTA